MWKTLVGGSVPAQNLCGVLVWHPVKEKPELICIHNDQVSIWELGDTPIQVAKIDHETEVQVAACFDPRDSSLLIASVVSGRLSFFRCMDQKLEVVEIEGQPSFDRGAEDIALCYDPEHNRMLLSTPDAVWLVEEKLTKIAGAYLDPEDEDDVLHLHSMSYDPNHKHVVLCGNNGYAHLVGSIVKPIPHDEDRTSWGFCSSAYHPELNTVVSFAGDGNYPREIWLLGKTIKRKKASIPTYWNSGSLIYNPRNRSLMVAGGTDNNGLTIWETRDFESFSEVSYRPEPSITNSGVFVSGKHLFHYEDSTGKLFRLVDGKFEWVCTQKIDFDYCRPILAQAQDGTLFAFTPMGELWQLENTAWKKLADASSGPGKRWDPAFAIGEQGPMIFGGSVGNRLQRDTWIFRQKSWQQVAKKKPPKSRAGAAMCAAANGRVILWGGDSKKESFHDLFVFDGDNWVEIEGSKIYGSVAIFEEISGALLTNSHSQIQQFVADKSQTLLEFPEFPKAADRRFDSSTFCGFDQSSRSFVTGAVEGDGEILALPLGDILDSQGTPPDLLTVDLASKKPAKKAKTRAPKMMEISVRKNRELIYLGSPKHTVWFRHAELSREKEADGENDFTHDRVYAELHIQVFKAHKKAPKNKWFKLVSLYCRDSYDDANELVLEDSNFFGPGFCAALAQLGAGATPKALIEMVGAQTDYPEGYALLARSLGSDQEILEDEEVVMAPDKLEKKPEPVTIQDVEQALVDAQELFEQGIEKGERLSTEAEPDYHPEYESTLAKAQSLINQIVQIDKTGRAYALCGRLAERFEYIWPVYYSGSATSWWQKALEDDPENIEYSQRLAYAYIRHLDMGKALKVLNKLVKADKNCAHYYYLRGYCHQFKARWEKAHKELDKAMKLAPNDPRFHELRALVYSTDGEVDKAKAEKKRAKTLRAEQGPLQLDATEEMVNALEEKLKTARGGDAYALEQLRSSWERQHPSPEQA